MKRKKKNRSDHFYTPDYTIKESGDAPFPSLAAYFSLMLRRVPRKEIFDITDRVPWVKKSVITLYKFVLWRMLSANVRRSIGMFFLCNML